MSPIGVALLCTFLPLATALLLLVLPGVRRTKLLPGLISVAVAGFALFEALQLGAHALAGGELGRVVVPWLPHATLGAHGAVSSAIELGVNLDGLSVSMLVVVCLVAFCVQVFSLGYMAHEPPADFGRYFMWQTLFLFAMNSLVIAPNLLQLFLGWELVGLVSYLLIGYYYRKPSAARAAQKAFFLTKLADMGLVAGLIVLFRHTGGFEWTVQTEAAGTVTLLLFFAVMGKSAQFPLHVWLPDAMEGPTPVSALLHAATMVAAGVFLVARAHPLFEQAPSTQDVMLYVGGFTALFAACVAVVQDDIKKVLAYSTCSQLGYMVCALGAGSQVAGFFHLTTHAVFKALLFLCAGGLIHAVHSNDVRDMGGLWSRMKVTGTTFIVGALALAGVPGLSGFFSKDLILEEVAHKGAYLPLAMLLGAAFLTAFYMGRITLLALFGKPSAHAEHAHESGLSMTLPLLILAVPAAGLGYLGAALSSLYTRPVHFHWSPVGIAATCLGLAGLTTAYVAFGPPARSATLLAPFAPFGRLARSGIVDRAYLFTYRRILRGLASAIGYFDRYVIDGLINALGYATLETGARLRPLQTGKTQDYVYAMALAMIALGSVAAFFR